MLFHNLTIIIIMIDFLKADPLNKSRVEDELIAWTWKKYLDTNGTDAKVLLRFPMTKVNIILDNNHLID
jgi:PhoPQ-activated pathogenicity-related protein